MVLHDRAISSWFSPSISVYFPHNKCNLTISYWPATGQGIDKKRCNEYGLKALRLRAGILIIPSLKPTLSQLQSDLNGAGDNSQGSRRFCQPASLTSRINWKENIFIKIFLFVSSRWRWEPLGELRYCLAHCDKELQYQFNDCHVLCPCNILWHWLHWPRCEDLSNMIQLDCSR